MFSRNQTTKSTENFSDNIINNTPNGIVVLNDKYEVQQINRAALKLMNIPRESDVMGIIHRSSTPSA